MKHWLIKESSILSTWNKRKIQQRKCQNLDCCTFDIDTSDQLVIFLICTSGLKICSIWSLICNFSSETFALLLVLLGLGELRTCPDDRHGRAHADKQADTQRRQREARHIGTQKMRTLEREEWVTNQNRNPKLNKHNTVTWDRDKFNAYIIFWGNSTL